MKLRLYLKKRYRHFKILFFGYLFSSFFCLKLFWVLTKEICPNLDKWWLFQTWCLKWEISCMFGSVLRIASAKLILFHCAMSFKLFCIDAQEITTTGCMTVLQQKNYHIVNLFSKHRFSSVPMSVTTLHGFIFQPVCQPQRTPVKRLRECRKWIYCWNFLLCTLYADNNLSAYTLYADNNFESC